MGVFDSFANRFRSDDDYDDDDLDEYDEDEDYDEQPRGRGLFGGKKQKYSDDDDEEDYDEQPVKSRTSIKGNSSSRSASVQNAPAARSSRGGAPAAGGRMQVRIIKPNSFDQARQITDTLLAHRTVLLNLEGLDINTAQRIVDFASGSCYALHGNFMKISQYIIVITPEDVDIAGDIAAAGAQEAAAASVFAGAAAQQGMMGAAVPNDASNPFLNGGMNTRMNGGY